MIKLKALIEGMSPEKAEDIFDKFGVKDTLSMPIKDVAKAYRELVKIHHPDKGGSTLDMQHINAAWDVLQTYGGGLGYTEPSIREPRTWTTPEAEYRAWRGYREPEPWAWAGYSKGSGVPPSDHISGTKDINYFKKKAWEISGKPIPDKENEYTFWNWDGSYFQGVFSVFTKPHALHKIALMMIEWDSSYKSKAVFFTRPGSIKLRKIYLIDINGQEIKPPKEFEHESFNQNPGNDQQFVNYLRRSL
jgi:hypothetical protein